MPKNHNWSNQYGNSKDSAVRPHRFRVLPLYAPTDCNRRKGSWRWGRGSVYCFRPEVFCQCGKVCVMVPVGESSSYPCPKQNCLRSLWSGTWTAPLYLDQDGRHTDQQDTVHHNPSQHSPKAFTLSNEVIGVEYNLSKTRYSNNTPKHEMKEGVFWIRQSSYSV